MKQILYLAILLLGVGLLSSCEKQDNSLANTRWEDTSGYNSALEFYENGRVVLDFNGKRNEGTYRLKDGTISFNLSGKGNVLRNGNQVGPAILTYEVLVEFQSGTVYLTSITAQVKVVDIKIIVGPSFDLSDLIGNTYDLEFKRVI